MTFCCFSPLDRPAEPHEWWRHQIHPVCSDWSCLIDSAEKFIATEHRQLYWGEMNVWRKLTKVTLLFYCQFTGNPCIVDWWLIFPGKTDVNANSNVKEKVMWPHLNWYENPIQGNDLQSRENQMSKRKIKFLLTEIILHNAKGLESKTWPKAKQEIRSHIFQ